MLRFCLDDFFTVQQDSGHVPIFYSAARLRTRSYSLIIKRTDYYETIMMHNWFECKIRYEKVAENGMNKKVTEPYLVDALSFTEAESRIIEEITPFISGEFTVADIKRANYSELFPCEEDAADRWFKCKLYFITLDEKSGTEKKTATNVLVQAADLRDAVKKLDEGMKGTMADYVIASVAETAIMDVYPYSAEPDVKPEFPEADKR